jgi:hypothetical protein
MKRVGHLGAFLFFVGCTSIAFAQQFTIKRAKLTVVVQADESCRSGLSVSSYVYNGHQLCADYPERAAKNLQKYTGSTFEIEALWTFPGDGSSNIPVGLGKVYTIAPVADTSYAWWQNKSRK